MDIFCDDAVNIAAAGKFIYNTKRIKMKNKLAFLLSILILITACKKQDKVLIDNKVEKQMTLLQVFMKTDGKELKEVFSQGNGTNKKTIFNIADVNAKKIFKYIILEANSSKRINLVSEIPLSSSMIDLNSFTETNKLYCIKNNINAKGNTSQSCITAKYNSQSYKLEGDNLLKLLNPTDDICIDWYWTTTDGETGELIGEIYLWTECNVHNGNGGGGGGNNGGDCRVKCEENFNILTSSSVAGDTYGFESSTITSFKKYKNPIWICLRNLTWHIKSKEIGIVELVNTSTNEWNWSSLIHSDLTVVGMTIGGSVSVTGTGTPSFVAGTQGVTRASMLLNFDVKYTPICDCPLISLLSTTIPYISTPNNFWDAKP
jgi:hypothetical protein